MRLNFRQRLLSSTLIVAAAALASPAYAQPADDDQPETPVEATIDPDAQDAEGTDSIIVTGSRIRRRDLESTSPLTVVQDEEFQLSGATNVEQVINTLPQVLPGVTGFSNNPGNGAVTLNLRNLGATRTLVLVNGRRFMFFDVAQVVDLNTIPQFLIESVDVVTGGASAVYGSDAVAGVVNFRLRDDLEGIHLGAQYSITEEGDGARKSLDLALGAPMADGRGNVTAFANYTKRESVFQGERNFSRFAAQDACIRAGSTDRRFGIGTSIGGSLATCVARGGEVGLAPGGSVLVPSTLELNTFLIFDNQGGGTRPFQDPADRYNYAPVNYLQLPQERYLFGGYGSYEITPGVKPFAEISFANNRVAQELAPTPIAQAVQVPINSPFFNEQTRQAFIAAGRVNAEGIANLFVGRRFVESGARNAESNR
ncbi:MAG TPA: TonB-dependent receptor plug domain-containing protein, partial [Allosphingosinicella sp.]|nr:TonB-dependent receptor plug domain-containing protein [Allosphingosinicella sp.]